MDNKLTQVRMPSTLKYMATNTFSDNPNDNRYTNDSTEKQSNGFQTNPPKKQKNQSRNDAVDNQ